MLVPATKTSNAKADGRFDKADFVYDREKNEYRCPAGQALIWRFAGVKKRHDAQPLLELELQDLLAQAQVHA